MLLRPRDPAKVSGGEGGHGASSWGLDEASHTHVSLSYSLQRHHLHRGAQHVPALRQEGLLW